MSVNLPEYVRNRNVMLSQAFENIKETVRRIQYWIEDEWLRIFVISDFMKDGRSKLILEQLETAFCIISIGQDENGEYSIVVSIDSQINEKIGYSFSSILLRRIYEFTNKSCDYNVRITDFSKDCDQYLQKVLKEHEDGIGYHEISITRYNGD